MNEELIKELAEHIEAGFVCFINPDTFEYYDVPSHIFENEFDGDLDLDFIEVDEEADISLDEVEWDPNDEFEIYRITLKKVKKWGDYIAIPPPSQRDSYIFMEQFASRISNRNFRKTVENALAQSKPFRSFKDIIEGSSERENWFSFHTRKIREYVRQELEDALEE